MERKEKIYLIIIVVLILIITISGISGYFGYKTLKRNSMVWEIENRLKMNELNLLERQIAENKGFYIPLNLMCIRSEKYKFTIGCMDNIIIKNNFDTEKEFNINIYFDESADSTISQDMVDIILAKQPLNIKSNNSISLPFVLQVNDWNKFNFPSTPSGLFAYYIVEIKANGELYTKEKIRVSLIKYEIKKL